MKTKNKRVSDKNKLVKKFYENVSWKLYKEALGSKQKGSGVYVLYSKCAPPILRTVYN